MSMQNKSIKLNSKFKKTIILYVISLFLTFLFLMLFLSIVANIIVGLDSLLNYVGPIVTIVCGVTILLTSLLFSMWNGEKGIFCGLVLSGSLYLTMIVASNIINNFSFSEFSMLKLLVILGCGVFGGYLGINIKEKFKNHH